MNVAALANRSTVRELVAVFAAAEQETRAAFGALVATEKRLNDAFALGDHLAYIHIDASHNGHDCNFTDADRTVRRMRKKAWRAIYERLELRPVLSPSRARAVERSLDEDEPPEITEANVTAFVKCWAEDLGELFAESVRDVFNWLRPEEGSWLRRYKTNDRVEVGRRVVLTWMVERKYAAPGYRVRVGTADERLTALENVMRYLDGGGQRPKGYRSDLANAIGESPDGTGRTDLFAFRAFKNGNLHLEFLRADLLQRLNAVAGGKNLRPAADDAA